MCKDAFLVLLSHLKGPLKKRYNKIYLNYCGFVKGSAETAQSAPLYVLLVAEVLL
jgi:hypothetical protein